MARPSILDAIVITEEPGLITISEKPQPRQVKLGEDFRPQCAQCLGSVERVERTHDWADDCIVIRVFCHGETEETRLSRNMRTLDRLLEWTAVPAFSKP